MIFRNI